MKNRKAVASGLIRFETADDGIAISGMPLLPSATVVQNIRTGLQEPIHKQAVRQHIR